MLILVEGQVHAEGRFQFAELCGNGFRNLDLGLLRNPQNREKVLEPVAENTTSGMQGEPEPVSGHDQA